MDRTYSVFDGAIRYYMPGLSPSSSPYRHPLFRKPFIESKGEEAVRRILVREIRARGATLRARPGFMQAVETWDLDRAKETLDAARTRETASGQVEAADARIQGLEQALESARMAAERVPGLQERVRELEEEIQCLEDLNTEQTGQLTEASNATRDDKREIFSLSQKLNALEEVNGAPEAPFTADPYLDALVGDSWSKVGMMLRLMQTKYADRLEVLDSALQSADASGYLYLGPLRELLEKFLTEYWEALRTSGDSAAAGILGDSYASHESSTLSASGRRARTFEYRGRALLMERHLKRTHGNERNTSNRVIRIHFHWDADEEKFVIGHCGKHLPL